jgi:hypothetical protein
MTDKTIRGLIKRGYLGPEERDNLTAIRQAMSLFLWDDLREKPKTKRTKKRPHAAPRLRVQAGQ